MEPTCKTPEEIEKFKVQDFNNTPGDLNEQDGYECKVCRNKGILMDAVLSDTTGMWTTVTRECKCMKVRRSIMRMKRSGLKDIIRDYTFDRFTADEDWQKSIKDAAQQYAMDMTGWLFLGGQSGSGKTHICTAVCRELLLSGHEVQYMLWRDDVVAIKQAVNDHDRYQEIMDKYKRVDVLYIDDLFKTGKNPDGDTQRPTAGDINAAFEILNSRYNNPKKLTIISSECTIDEILDIDEAVGGRIYERSKVINIRPDRSRNYRLKGAVDL